MSKNDDAWENLFMKYDILKHIDKNGQFRITSEQIKEFREPRLMTKFDHRINLPALFSKHDLAILPVTRGDYIIAHFDAYHELEHSDSYIEKVNRPDNIQSLDYNNIQSEAIALNCALAAGIIADFLEDDSLIATASGRMGTGSFDFSISDTKSRTLRNVNVINAQMEIDASYEGNACMAVFEAKLAKREISEDFMIRQLYYPFRVWHERIIKPVRPVFFVYSNDVFRLYEYVFDDRYNYSSIRLLRQKNYSVEDTAISASDIQNVMNNAIIKEEPNDIPFPQADKFERVINLCELLYENDMSKSEITEEYSFNERQSDYYANSARYLGLAYRTRKDGKTCYTLTDNGRKILRMNYRDRQLELCKLILSHRIFNEILCIYFTRGSAPANDEIMNIMKSLELHNVTSEETFRRRASTVRGWLEWIAGLITE
ncbi:MAG: hypothetical protein IJS42_01600 [Synergistaceae bacterium]|nr:hypothetical protein [Synergistaceae bacterium]